MTMKMFYALLWCVLIVCADQQSESEKITVPESTIHRLFERVLEGQTRTDVLDVSGVNSKGNYENLEILQYVGDRPGTSQKWIVFKNLLISTISLYVSSTLMDAYLYGGAPRPLDEQLISTVEFCSTFRDVTIPYSNSLLKFSQCVFIDKLNSCVPTLSGSVEFRRLDKCVTNHSLVDHENRDKSVAGKIVGILNEKMTSVMETDNLHDINNILLQLFKDPGMFSNGIPDSDATFLWLGLGSILEMLRDEFPKVWETWIKDNLNTSSCFDALKKYSYRPFSDNPLVNTIDPANYYVIRHFLDHAKSSGQDVALASVWFTNADEKPVTDQGNIYHKSINNVDGYASANVINGITISVLSGLVGPEILEDPEVSQIYLNTSAMLAYLINSNFSNRPDLVLTFAPSRYMFYLAVARTVSFIDYYTQRKIDLPVTVIELVFNSLKQALEGEATRFIISDVKRDDDGYFYFDDFLGNGDLTEDNQPIIRGEDRIFTTSMAANVLMYTWLTFDYDSEKSYWKTGTPEIVKNIVNGCIMWLVKNIFDAGFEPWNVYFTMQNIGRDTMSFRYPANLFLEIPQLYALQFVTNLRVIVGIEGYIPKSIYEAMINKTHFGKPTPTVFKGFNDPSFGDKIFWSSDPITYASALLALSRYREIATIDETSVTNLLQ